MLYHNLVGNHTYQWLGENLIANTTTVHNSRGRANLNRNLSPKIIQINIRRKNAKSILLVLLITDSQFLLFTLHPTSKEKTFASVKEIIEVKKEVSSGIAPKKPGACCE